MTYQQLVDFYHHLQLPFSQEATDLLVLRKQLLLELKSGGETLEIFTTCEKSIGRSTKYSKNDLIQLFDELEVHPFFNTETFLETAPFLRPLLLPEKMGIPEYHLPPDFIDLPGLESFRRQELAPRFRSYLSTLRAAMAEIDLDNAYVCTIYLEAFSESEQFEAKKVAKEVFRTAQFAKIRKTLKRYPIVREQHFYSPRYYYIVREIAGDDPGFLHEQLTLGEDINFEHRHMPPTLVRFLRHQCSLPFPEPTMSELRQQLEKMEKVAANWDNHLLGIIDELKGDAAGEKKEKPMTNKQAYESAKRDMRESLLREREERLAKKGGNEHSFESSKTENSEISAPKSKPSWRMRLIIATGLLILLGAILQNC